MSVGANLVDGVRADLSQLSTADEEKFRLFNQRILALRNEDPLSSGSGFSSSAYSTEDEDAEGSRSFPKEDYLGEFVEPDEELVQKIISQVEYYFSDAHVHRDPFMQKHIRRTPEGFISIKLLTCFRKVKRLSKDYRVVAFSLKKSNKLQVNQLGTKVKRIVPFPKDLCERGVQVVLVGRVDASKSDDVIQDQIKTLFCFLFENGAGKNEVKPKCVDVSVDDESDSVLDTHAKIDYNKSNEDKKLSVDFGNEAIISDIRVLREWKYIPKMYRDSHSQLFTFSHNMCSVLIDLFYPSVLCVQRATEAIKDAENWMRSFSLHQLPCPQKQTYQPRRKNKASKVKAKEENEDWRKKKENEEYNALRSSQKNSPSFSRKNITSTPLTSNKPFITFDSSSPKDRNDMMMLRGSPSSSSSSTSSLRNSWSSPTNSPLRNRRKIGPSPLVQSPRPSSPWHLSPQSNLGLDKKEVVKVCRQPKGPDGNGFNFHRTHL